MVILMPEEPEDMWQVYNLISVGDFLKASTIRKVMNESATGSVTSERVRTRLTIEVDKIDFDTGAGVLRINGKNVEENRHVKLGQYHTIELELNRQFTLSKKEWDSVALERLNEACDVAKKAEIAAIVLQEGLAHICLVTNTMTIVKQRIEVNIPKKRRGSSTDYEKALKRFLEQVNEAMLRHLDLDLVKAVIIASPAFVKDKLFELINQEAVRTENKKFFEAKHKFLCVHASSGHKHALMEVLKDPSVMVKIADTKACKEQEALDGFFKMLSSDPDSVCYGWDHVKLALERQAIKTLLISDALFRSVDIKTRKQYVELVDAVKEARGNVFIFSSLHVTGEQLGQFTGVAAILMFPIPDLDEVIIDIKEGNTQQHS